MICETYHQTGIVVILKRESLWQLGTFEEFNLHGGVHFLVSLLFSGEINIQGHNFQRAHVSVWTIVSNKASIQHFFCVQNVTEAFAAPDFLQLFEKYQARASYTQSTSSAVNISRAENSRHTHMCILMHKLTIYKGKNNQRNPKEKMFLTCNMPLIEMKKRQ